MFSFFRLTGRPTEQQWPQTISVALEHFPQRHPKRPKDFCPLLCEYADDLLNVSIKKRKSKFISRFVFPNMLPSKFKFKTNNFINLQNTSS